MKGICSLCGKHRWLGGKGRACKPCAYPVGACTNCSKRRKLYVDELCYLCYQDRQIRNQLVDLESSLMPQSEYESYLFQLYLTYIRRYLLRYAHLNQAQRLSVVLRTYSIKPLLSWMQIYKWAQQHPLPHRLPSPNGCAWTKIGYMLQELGVLPPRTEETGRQFDSLRSSIYLKNWKRIEPFLFSLRGLANTETSLIRYLFIIRGLQRFLDPFGNEQTDLLSVNEIQIRGFLDHLRQSSQTSSAKYLRSTLLRLSKFYRFCYQEKWILCNPCERIKVSREAAKLTVCSPEQIAQLEAFVKNPASDPEHAILICLILFFGLKTEDLAFASLQVQTNNSFAILLRRKARSRGRHFYHRPQLLQLPAQPKWFFDLQKRFYEVWLEFYSQVKKTYPHYPLVLCRNYRANRPLSADTISQRIQEATRAATGSVEIPPSILRQTCGHLHSQNQDASLLSRLGWSPEFAFHYTWLPRAYYVPKDLADTKSVRTGEFEAK